MIRFKCTINPKDIEVVLGIPIIEVGIYKNKPAVNFNPDKSMRSLCNIKGFRGTGSGIPVNKPMTKAMATNQKKASFVKKMKHYDMLKTKNPKIFTGDLIRKAKESFKANTAKNVVMISEIYSGLIGNNVFTGNFLKAVFNKSEDGIWLRYLNSKKGDDDKRKLSHGIRAFVLNAYANFALAKKPSPRTIARKGHALSMIATGTTFCAIEGKYRD